MKRLLTVVCAALLASAIGLATAGPPGKAPKGAGHGAAGHPPGGKGKEAVHLFSPRESELIRAWFAEPAHLEGLPPGLAKRERLPPGLEKQLRRNGTLPPGLEKKLHPLPDDLAVRLPPLPGGLRRVILGEHVLILDERTSAIVDVLFGAARLAGTF